MRVVITEFMDEAPVASLAARFDVTYDATLVDRPAELWRTLADADAVIVRNKTQVNAALLAAASRLKVVGRLGVGLDNIDLPACKARGIEVIPASGANALAVAEYVIGAAMLLLRGAYASTAAVSEGKWPRAALSNGREIAGKTLGVVGFGGIGRLTGEARASARHGGGRLRRADARRIRRCGAKSRRSRWPSTNCCARRMSSRCTCR